MFGSLRQPWLLFGPVPAPTGADVYGTIIIGKGAYGVVDVAGKSKPETIIKPLGSAGAADPLNQRATVGWKAFMTAVRLQELAILRVEHTVSI